MKSSAKNISLTSLDELFSTEEERSSKTVESVVRIPISELYDFPDHPFKVHDDERLTETVESVKEYGVLVPIIVRPRDDGGYEIVSGHRRKRACELAGIPDINAIVRELDNDSATIIMVDSNLQRENILPSERAQAYKMKLEAIKHQGERRDLTSTQVGQKSQYSVEKVAEDAGQSRSQVQRYIRLTELAPEIQSMVDSGRIAMTPAVELSYLTPEQQAILLETMQSEQVTPSLSQAQRIRKLSQSGELNEDNMLSILSEQKKPERSGNITLPSDRLKKYFPKSYTPAQIENVIYKLLDGWLKKRRHELNL